MKISRLCVIFGLILINFYPLISIGAVDNPMSFGIPADDGTSIQCFISVEASVSGRKVSIPLKIPQDTDQCPASDTSPYIVIDDCSTGVENQLLSNGCTILDKIAECALGAENHGDFVNCVSHMTNELKRLGLITGSEKESIQSCAAQADIP